MSDGDELKELERLARATEGLRPRPALADAVMARIEAEAEDAVASVPPLREGIARTGPRALLVAAVAAAAAIAIAIEEQQTFDSTVLSTVDVVEVYE